MPLIQFTRNYKDRSNNHGFQFEFYCDKCNNGHMSPFKASSVGIAASVLKAAGSFFGGAVSRAAYAGDHVKDALRGKARDEAYAESVQEAKAHFKNCTRCGHWVCPRNCWNETRNLCESCAPNLAEEAAHIQSKVAVEQAWDKARKVDQVEALDMKATRMAACPHCNASVEGGKFCPECGKPLAAKTSCGKCGAEMGAKAKFCPECGSSRA
ncbi:zinc ribbon domain-containing protein [Hyalangium rubrum]|uniref:Zinc ribbon domain-containing protein n=1 Tax=Hyalangium rubrum TaxID=3103134 RepID=A0ABU5H2E4_9BACT|nr:zinc ribbon domain-containing protein [Hyalangium sp. s54d21]MDY7227069.1 zinc ribbon domain-containing protein [Hyalangium sp. s54d21]